MERIIHFFRSHPWETFFLFIYVVTTFCTVWHHEPWLDEAQAWIVARDCSFPELWDQMKYEGSPAMWHLILVPFAKLGLPYFSMSVMNWIFACGIAFLWLYFAPFNLWTRVAGTFTYTMLYEYAVKARCYSVVIMLLLAATVLYAHRFHRPILYAILVGLSCQTSLLCFGIAGGLGALFAWDILISPPPPNPNNASMRRQVIALGIMAGLGILAFLQVYPPKSIAPYNRVMEFTLPVIMVATYFMDFFASDPPVSPYKIFRYNNEIKCFIEVGYNVLVMLLPFALLWITRKTRFFWLTCITYIPVVILHLLLAYFWHRHYAFYLVFAVIILWLWHTETRVNLMTSFDPVLAFVRKTFQFILLLSLPFAGFYTLLDWKFPYSGSQAIAQFLKDNKLEKHTVITHYYALGVPILPYLPCDTKFWLIHKNDYGTYMKNDDEHFIHETKMTVFDIIKWVKKNIPDKMPVILILSYSITEGREYPQLKLLYENEGRVMTLIEKYSVFLLE